eukprot:3598648-Amphidinium_carterae.1
MSLCKKERLMRPGLVAKQLGVCLLSGRDPVGPHYARVCVPALNEDAWFATIHSIDRASYLQAVGGC